MTRGSLACTLISWLPTWILAPGVVSAYSVLTRMNRSVPFRLECAQVCTLCALLHTVKSESADGGARTAPVISTIESSMLLVSSSSGRDNAKRSVASPN